MKNKLSGTNDWRLVPDFRYLSDYPNFTGHLITKDNDIAWCKNGRIHREDGPAIEWDDGSKEWYKNGKKHREDGPAGEYANGNRRWFKNGLEHREDGPAFEWANGDKEWYINDYRYTEQEYRIAIRKYKLERILKIIKEKQ